MKLNRIALIVALLFCTLPLQARAANGYISVFGGAARFSETSATFTDTQLVCILSPCTTVTNVNGISLGDGFVYGIRTGIWFKYFGVAMEYISTDSASASSPLKNAGRVSYSTTAVTPMARLPLFTTDASPDGLINVYGGLAVSRDCTKLTVYSPQFSSAQTIDNCSSNSPAMLNPLIGIAYNHAQFSIFIEQRSVTSKIKDSMLLSSGSADIHMKMSTVGMAYSF